MTRPYTRTAPTRPPRTVCCDMCGNLFQTSSPFARYCSSRCKHAWHRLIEGTYRGDFDPARLDSFYESEEERRARRQKEDQS